MRYFIDLLTGEYFITDTDMSSEFVVECLERPGDNYEFNTQLMTWEFSRELALVDIREQRNELLRSTDWTQLPDCDLSGDMIMSIKVYRQQLRDFPETCDAQNPQWPINPLG